MILVYGLTGFAFAFVLMWRFWPDPDAARAGDIKESDLLPLTKRDTPSHVADGWRDDLTSISDSIDRAIALAASLPGEGGEGDGVGQLPPRGWAAWTATCIKCGDPFVILANERVYLTPQGAAVAAAL